MKKTIAIACCMLFACTAALTSARTSKPSVYDEVINVDYAVSGKGDFKVSGTVVDIKSIMFTVHPAVTENHVIIKTATGLVDVCFKDQAAFDLVKLNEKLVLPNCRLVSKSRQHKIHPIKPQKATLYKSSASLQRYRC